MPRTKKGQRRFIDSREDGSAGNTITILNGTLQDVREDNFLSAKS